MVEQTGFSGNGIHWKNREYWKRKRITEVKIWWGYFWLQEDQLGNEGTGDR